MTTTATATAPTAHRGASFYLKAELAETCRRLRDYHRRRDQAGHQDIHQALEGLRHAGQSPRAVRAQLRRQAFGPAGLADLQDRYPRMTDGHLDTLLRRACAVVYGPGSWISTKV